jgi:hypothetical protein
MASKFLPHNHNTSPWSYFANADIISSWYIPKSMQTSYELTNSTAIWNYRTHDLLTQLRDQIDRFACSGGVWTQTTDVEGEVNGLMTYDRRVIRMDEEMWRADVSALYVAAAKRAVGNGNGSMAYREVMGQVGLP